MKIILAGSGPIFQALATGFVATQIKHLQKVDLFLWPCRPNWPSEKAFLKSFRAHDSVTFLNASAKLNSSESLASAKLNRSESWAEIEKIKPDVILLATWGELIRPETLQALPCPVINCHPSALPQYRGPNPYFYLIKNSETQTAVTFHVVDSGIDTGPILLQTPLIPISLADNGASLRLRCAEAVFTTIPDLLKALSQPELRTSTTMQDDSQASYFSRPRLDEFRLDWQDYPDDVWRVARACMPWFASWSTVKGLRVGFESVERLSQLAKTEIKPAKPGQIIQVSWRSITVQSSDPSIAFRLNTPFFMDTSPMMSSFMRLFYLHSGVVLS